MKQLIFLLLLSNIVVGQSKGDTTRAILILKDKYESFIPAVRMPGYVVRHGKYWKQFLDIDKKPILKNYSVREYHL